jgi:multicomponent Na+:H+ antiporter subunit F
MIVSLFGINLWTAAGVLVMAALLPCASMCLRGSPERRLVGLEMTGLIVTTALVLFTVGFGRIPFIDIALALAIMSFGSGLLFARFLGKYL